MVASRNVGSFLSLFLVPSMLKHVSASIWNDSDSPEYIVARFKHAKRCSNIYHAKTSFILNCLKA